MLARLAALASLVPQAEGEGSHSASLRPHSASLRSHSASLRSHTP
ncbi:hypothetical protein AKJ09_07513 [Labilithrix luteola]|uniref:Uncharacterized protein n=1 Tax=Labilithrix luteola TaxID=1391654 RepID=A0A0K1Q623_9BACT|nr:hypothetical protein AKJ09_07513 [Labilithrix luteola]